MNIYYLLMDNTDWGEQDKRLLQAVSERRREKVMRYRFLADRRLSLYSALLVRMELSLVTGIPANELRFSGELNQKPVFLSEAQYRFSVSHTRNVILCGISSHGDVGVDVERINTAPLDIMELVFHPEEIAYVQEASAYLKNIRFYEIWTKKEAYTKQMGVGLGDNPTLFNTLEHSDCFSIWRQDDYMCCVYEEGTAFHQMSCISVKEIQQYYSAVV